MVLCGCRRGSARDGQRCRVCILSLPRTAAGAWRRRAGARRGSRLARADAAARSRRTRPVSPGRPALGGAGRVSRASCRDGRRLGRLAGDVAGLERDAGRGGEEREGDVCGFLFVETPQARSHTRAHAARRTHTRRGGWGIGYRPSRTRTERGVAMLLGDLGWAGPVHIEKQPRLAAAAATRRAARLVKTYMRKTRTRQSH